MGFDVKKGALIAVFSVSAFCASGAQAQQQNNNTGPATPQTEQAAPVKSKFGLGDVVRGAQVLNGINNEVNGVRRTMGNTPSKSEQKVVQKVNAGVKLLNTVLNTRL